MITRTFFSLGVACSSILVCAGQTAHASSQPSASLEMVTDFDLARSLDARTDDRRFRFRPQERGPLFRDETMKPQVSYSPISGGPTVELGALGGGKKGSPRLAHVRVDWSF